MVVSTQKEARKERRCILFSFFLFNSKRVALTKKIKRVKRFVIKFCRKSVMMKTFWHFSICCNFSSRFCRFFLSVSFNFWQFLMPVFVDFPFFLLLFFFLDLSQYLSIFCDSSLYFFCPFLKKISFTFFHPVFF